MNWIYTEENPLRVFEAFAGYGSQAMAIRNLGIPYKVVGISEIDKNAITAYMAVHGGTPNYGDISKVDWTEVPDFDLFTYSFPCTDISNAGVQMGFAEGSGTRSSLLWECKRAIEVKKPTFLLMENVKALVSEKFLPGYHQWVDYPTRQGYTSFTEILNAKDYGIPQNRERVFMVSISGSAWFSFPQPRELKLKLKDVLEENVEEKYYLDDSKVAEFIGQLEEDKKRLICKD